LLKVQIKGKFVPVHVMKAQGL